MLGCSRAATNTEKKKTRFCCITTHSAEDNHIIVCLYIMTQHNLRLLVTHQCDQYSDSDGGSGGLIPRTFFLLFLFLTTLYFYFYTNSRFILLEKHGIGAIGMQLLYRSISEWIVVSILSIEKKTILTSEPALYLTFPRVKKLNFARYEYSFLLRCP